MPASADASTPCRHFLGWDRPLLDAVVEWLAAEWREGAMDLSHCLVIVPTRQSGRRLREALALRAAEKGAGVLAPVMMTPEAFASACAAPEVMLATPVESLAAWASVLMAARLEEMRALFPVPPPEQNLSWALSVAESLEKARAALAEGGLSFGLEGASDAVPETERWEQLAALEARYLAALRQRGLWDAQAAKIAARTEPHWPWEEATRAVLAGVPDPLPLAVDMLAALGRPVDVLVWGPESEAAHFDEWGRPQAAAWGEREIGLPAATVRIHPLADPQAQAAKAASFLPAHEQPARTLALGLADPSLQRAVERAFAAEGVASFAPDGAPAASHPLLKWLAAWSELLRGGEWAAFVRLLRLPPLAEALGWKSASWLLKAADTFQAKHFPLRFEDVPELADREDKGEAAVAEAAEIIAHQRREFVRHPLPVALAQFAAWAFAGRVFASEGEADAGWSELTGRCAELAGEIAAALPSVKTAEQLALMLNLLGKERLAAPHDEAAVELSGWLELPWQGAPHLVVAGFNDAFVPAAPGADPFLPDSLRHKLGLRCHQTRVARDAYWLTAMIESRRAAGRVDLLFGQTGAGEAALRPSRLLLRCPDEMLPARVRQLFAEAAPAPSPAPSLAWQLQPRATADQVALKKMGVTSFATYLQCPLRFFLKHILRMREVDATQQELDPRAFGSLCHAAFEALAQDERAKRSGDADVVRACLLDGLERKARALFGVRQPLSLLLQLEAARQRLGAAAQAQAREQAAGWIIAHVEKSLGDLRPNGAPFVLGGMEISGQVDRVDINERTGCWRVVDYKTSAEAKKPEELHTAKAGGEEWPAWRVLPDGARVWTGLQLPLYGVALAEAFGPDGGAAFFNLPKAITETRVETWEGLDAAMLDSALCCAEGVIAAIKARVFWPPAEKVPFDDLAALWPEGVAACVAAPRIDPALATTREPEEAPAP